MRNLALLTFIAAISLGPQPQYAAADEVPTYDVRRSCKVDVQADPSGSGAASCLADERKAREALVSQWTQFAPQARAKCMQTVGDISGSQSYVELLTCLQMAQDVNKLPKN